MENKINVAELLRKCPEGMELDCTLFSKPLKYSGFEGFKDDYPIRTVAENGEIFWFTKEGCIHNNMYSKCVIFPKGKFTWEGFVPPCTFKKGDVLITQTGSMVLFSHIDFEDTVHYHCILPPGGNLRIEKNVSIGVGEYRDCIVASGHQKQRMYDRIKSAGYKYNQDTNKLEKIYEFKDGDICYIKTKSNEHIFIFNCIDNYGIKRYANLTKNGFYKDDVNIVCTEKVIEEFRYATEEEKGRLFKSIKDHGYMWNPEKKCLEELPRFKNGDVVATNSGTWIGIVEKQESDIAMTTHCVLKDTGDFEAYLEEKGRWCFSRLATEDEKQRLFNALRENNYEWNSKEKCLEPLVIKPKFKIGDEVKFSCRGSIFIITAVNDKYYCLAEKGSTITFPALISSDKDWELVSNKFDITTLKRFEQVLVRNYNTDEWDIDLFGYYSRGFYHTTGRGLYRQCIPYIGNEHIAGTSVNCDDYYKNWSD